MSKASYFLLLSRIEGSHVFTNNSHNPQMGVKFQLLVALAHLGLYGNGASVVILAHLFGISGQRPFFFFAFCMF